MKFMGLTPQVFEAYQSKKCSSHVYNLDRMQAKNSLESLCQAIALDLKEEFKDLSHEISDHIPNIMNKKKVDSQWFYWSRNKEQREQLRIFLQKTPLKDNVIFQIAPQEKHASLACILSEKDIWMGIKIFHTAIIDRGNLLAKLSQSWNRKTFLKLLKNMPDTLMIGYENETIPIEKINDDILQSYGKTLTDKTSIWEIGYRISADKSIDLKTLLISHIKEWIIHLLPVYHYILWSKENDFIQINKEIKEKKEEERRKINYYKKGDKIRITGGIFAGKNGFVSSIDTKQQVKVRIGKMSVVISAHDIVSMN